MNIDELYKYVGQRTGLNRFHMTLEYGKTEFTDQEAEEIAECIEFVCAEQKKHEAERRLKRSLCGKGDPAAG